MNFSNNLIQKYSVQISIYRGFIMAKLSRCCDLKSVIIDMLIFSVLTFFFTKRFFSLHSNPLYNNSAILSVCLCGSRQIFCQWALRTFLAHTILRMPIQILCQCALRTLLAHGRQSSIIDPLPLWQCAYALRNNRLTVNDSLSVKGYAR